MMGARHAVATIVAITMLATSTSAATRAADEEPEQGSWSRGTGVITIDQELLESQLFASLTWDRLLPLGCGVYQTSYPAVDVEDLPDPRLRLRFDLDEGTFSGVISGRTGSGELSDDAEGSFRLIITDGTMTPDGHDWTLQGNGVVSLGYALTTTCVTSPEDSTRIVRSRAASGGGSIPIEGEIDLGSVNYVLELDGTQGPAEKQFRLWVSGVEVGTWVPEPVPEPSEEADAGATGEVLDGDIDAVSLDGQSRKDIGLFLLIVAFAGGEELLVDTLLEWSTGPYERYLLRTDEQWPQGLTGTDGPGDDIDGASDVTGPDHPGDMVIESPGGALDLMDEQGAADEADALDEAERAANEAVDTDADTSSAGSDLEAADTTAEEGADQADPSPSAPPDDGPAAEPGPTAPTSSSFAPGPDTEAGVSPTQPAADQDLDEGEAERIAAVLLESMDPELTKQLEDARHRENLVRTLRALVDEARSSDQPAEARPSAAPGPAQPSARPTEELVDPLTGLTEGEEKTLEYFWRLASLQAAYERHILISGVVEALAEDERAYADKVVDVLVGVDSDD